MINFKHPTQRTNTFVSVDEPQFYLKIGIKDDKVVCLDWKEAWIKPASSFVGQLIERRVMRRYLRKWLREARRLVP